MEMSMKTASRWNEDATYSFVKEFIKYPCLYNPTSKQFRDKLAKNNAVINLSRTMNLPNFGPNEVYMKIRSLKSTYCQEIRKIQHALIKGTVYTPRLRWYQLMHDAINQSCVDLKEENCSVPDLFTVLPDSNQSTDENSIIEDNEIGSDENEDVGNVKIPIMRSPMSRTLRELSSIMKSVKETSARLVDTSNQFAESEFDEFGRVVAAQLKCLPLQAALQLQMSMHNQLINARLEYLQKSYQNEQNPMSSPYTAGRSSPTEFHPSPQLKVEYLSEPEPNETDELISSVEVI